MLQRWRAVGNTVSDLTRPRFKLLTSRSRDERVTARPTGGPETKYRFISWFTRRLICLLPLRFSPNLLFGRLTKLTFSTSSFFHMVKQQLFSKHALILFKLAVIVAQVNKRFRHHAISIEIKIKTEKAPTIHYHDHQPICSTAEFTMI